jgi:hypothetical protein
MTLSMIFLPWKYIDCSLEMMKGGFGLILRVMTLEMIL